MPRTLEEVLSSESPGSDAIRVETLQGDRYFPIDIADALDAGRMAEGEDPYSGVAPVTEEVFDAAVRPPPDVTPVIAYMTWTSEERPLTLSRVPCEVLSFLWTQFYGRKWWDQEPEVLIEDLGRGGFIVDAGGMQKVRALHALHSSPQGISVSHQDPETFRFVTQSLCGIPTTHGDGLHPTPETLNLGISLLQHFRPHPLTDEVLAYVAAVLFSEGHWALEGPVAVAQRHILRICSRLDIAVDQERVDTVLALAAREREDEDTIAEEGPYTSDEVQALMVLELERAFERDVAYATDALDSLQQAMPDD